jgi:hypothetical protein
MTIMKSTLAIGAALLGVALPIVAAAQSSPTDLELQRKQKRSIVLPKQSPEQIRMDADQAVSEYAAGQPMGRVVRENSAVRPPARPDLNYDVTGGIQQRRLNDALQAR